MGSIGSTAAGIGFLAIAAAVQGCRGAGGTPPSTTPPPKDRLDLRGIADAEARRNGFDPGRMRAVYDDRSDGAIKWAVQIGRTQSEKLKSKNWKDVFIAYYGPPLPPPGKVIIGAELVVYVDRKTGDILYSVSFHKARP